MLKIIELIDSLKKHKAKSFRLNVILDNNIQVLIQKGDPYIENSDYTDLSQILKTKEDEENIESNEKIEEIIKSPLVGTFYEAKNQDSLPFIKIGQEINENTILCLIESMKSYNEIFGGMKGIISEILVKNGDFVEFEQPLFKIVKNDI